MNTQPDFQTVLARFKRIAALIQQLPRHEYTAAMDALHEAMARNDQMAALEELEARLTVAEEQP